MLIPRDSRVSPEAGLDGRPWPWKGRGTQLGRAEMEPCQRGSGAVPFPSPLPVWRETLGSDPGATRKLPGVPACRRPVLYVPGTRGKVVESPIVGSLGVGQEKGQGGFGLVLERGGQVGSSEHPLYLQRLGPRDARMAFAFPCSGPSAKAASGRGFPGHCMNLCLRHHMGLRSRLPGEQSAVPRAPQGRLTRGKPARP